MKSSVAGKKHAKEIAKWTQRQKEDDETDQTNEVKVVPRCSLRWRVAHTYLDSAGYTPARFEKGHIKGNKSLSQYFMLTS